MDIDIPVIMCVVEGIEADVVKYYRRGDVRVGCDCSCGATIIDGILVGSWGPQ